MPHEAPIFLVIFAMVVRFQKIGYLLAFLLLLLQTFGFTSRLVRTQNLYDYQSKAVASALILKSKNTPEVVSFDNNEPDKEDESNEKNMVSYIDDEEISKGTSGQFQIKKTKPPTILNGELPPPQIFRGKRKPTPIMDNLIVVGLTILGLAGAMGFFLFLNKVRTFKSTTHPL